MDILSGPAVRRSLKRKQGITAFSVFAVLLSGLLFTKTAINGSFLATLAGLGLDPPRGRFVASLLLTVLVSLVAALLSRLRVTVLLAGLAFFCVSYLADFLSNATQPLHDPGGFLEPLDKLALLHTVFMMLALAGLACCVGISLGRGLAYALVDPVLHLISYLRQPEVSLAEYDSLSAASFPLPLRRSRLIRDLVQAFALMLALVLALGSFNLFVYGPEVALHLSPSLANLNVSQNPLVSDSYISRAMGGQRRTFVVYLPPSYNTSAAKTRRYPVLYLLHGSPGQQMNWMTGGKAGQSEETLSPLGKAPELILVMPDGNGRGGETSEWANSGDGKQLLENAIVDDLIPYVDQKYRTIPDVAHRGIGGLSMGGFGAANIGIHHPDLFSFIIALGGYYHASGTVWGKNPAYLRANSPADLLPQQKLAWHLHYYIGGATKDDLYQESVTFSQELKQFHIPYTFESVNGYHAWSVWQVEFYHALEWLQTVIPS